MSALEQQEGAVHAAVLGIDRTGREDVVHLRCENGTVLTLVSAARGRWRWARPSGVMASQPFQRLADTAIRDAERSR